MDDDLLALPPPIQGPARSEQAPPNETLITMGIHVRDGTHYVNEIMYR